jgi:hypothetical protein
MGDESLSANGMPAGSAFNPRTVALFIVLVVIAAIYLFYLP